MKTPLTKHHCPQHCPLDPMISRIHSWHWWPLVPTTMASHWPTSWVKAKAVKIKVSTNTAHHPSVPGIPRCSCISLFKRVTGRHCQESRERAGGKRWLWVGCPLSELKAKQAHLCLILLILQLVMSMGRHPIASHNSASLVALRKLQVNLRIIAISSAIYVGISTVVVAPGPTVNLFIVVAFLIVLRNSMMHSQRNKHPFS